MRLKEAELSLRRFLKLNNKSPPTSETGWEKHPRSFEEIKLEKSYGIAGREGLVFIDVDREEVTAFIRKRLPPTFETISPRRKLPHFYFKVTNGEVQNTTLHLPDVKEGCGEIRAQNYYVVGPGSIINYKNLTTKKWETGKYKILNDRPIATVTYNIFMKVITPLLKSKDDPQGTQKITYKQMREGVPKGMRHAQGIRYATFLIKVQKFDASTTLHEMQTWNQLCKPPMNTKDIERMVKNAIAYPDRKTPKETGKGGQKVMDSNQTSCGDCSKFDKHDCPKRNEMKRSASWSNLCKEYQDRKVTQIGEYTLKYQKNKVHLIDKEGNPILASNYSSIAGPTIKKRLVEYTDLSTKKVERIIAKFTTSIDEYKLSPDKKPSIAEQLISLCQTIEAQYFHDQHKTPYMKAQDGKINKIFLIKSRECKRFLSNLYYENTQKICGKEPIDSAILQMEAFATNGEMIKLQNRISSTKEKDNYTIWMDMCDDKWRAIKITEYGWKIVNDPPILFRRHSHMLPLCEPTPNKEFNNLDGIDGIVDTMTGVLTVPNFLNSAEQVVRGEKKYNDIPNSYHNIDNGVMPTYAKSFWKFLEYVNIEKEDQLLLLIHMAHFCIPDIPHTLLNIYGPHGSAKTMLFRLIKNLIDPTSVMSKGLPSKKNELIQQLYHHYLSFYDNVSFLSNSYSDELCRAITGGGSSKRSLYTNDQDVIYQFHRGIGLNGINISVQREDLLDRTVLLKLLDIKEEDRKAEGPFLKAFEKDKHDILSGLLNVLVVTLRIYPTIKLEKMFRMADYTQWGCAISESLGVPQRIFIEKYKVKVVDQIREAVYGSIIGNTLLDFMSYRKMWKGSPADLHHDMKEHAKSLNISTRVKEWPKAPSIMSRRLNLLLSSFKALGIDITKERDPLRVVKIVNRNYVEVPPEKEEPKTMGDIEEEMIRFFHRKTFQKEDFIMKGADLGVPREDVEAYFDKNPNGTIIHVQEGFFTWE